MASDAGFISRVRDLFGGADDTEAGVDTEAVVDTEATDRGGDLAERGGDGGEGLDTEPLQGEWTEPGLDPNGLVVDPADTPPDPPDPEPDGGFGTGASGPILGQPISDAVTMGPDLTATDDSVADGYTTSTDPFTTFADDGASAELASVEGDSASTEFVSMVDDTAPPDTALDDDVPA